MTIALLLAAAFPLWRLTRPSIQAAITTVSAPETKAKVHLALTFAHAPKSFQVLHLGKTIWESPVPASSTSERDVEMAFPKEGVDLEIKAAWPNGTPQTAVRVAMTPPDGNPMEKTIWGNEHADEVVTFP